MTITPAQSFGGPSRTSLHPETNKPYFLAYGKMLAEAAKNKNTITRALVQKYIVDGGVWPAIWNSSAYAKAVQQLAFSKGRVTFGDTTYRIQADALAYLKLIVASGVAD